MTLSSYVPVNPYIHARDPHTDHLYALILTSNSPFQVKLSSFEGDFKQSTIYWARGTSSATTHGSDLPDCLASLDTTHTMSYVTGATSGLQQHLVNEVQSGSSKTSYASLAFGNESLLPACAETDSGSFYLGNWTLHYNATTVNALPSFMALVDSSTLFGNAETIKVGRAPTPLAHARI